jgi:ribosomal protein L7/L12
MINIGQLRKIKTSLSNAKLPELSAEIQAMAADPSRKIEAIKAYREMTGLGLAKARRAVEDYLASRNRGGQS